MHRSPRIMNVAVPSFQHSEMLGQPASSQTVTRSRPRSVERTLWNVGPVLSGTRIHSGLRDRSGTGSRLSPSSRAAERRPSRRGDTPSAAAPAGVPLGAVSASAALSAASRVNWAMSVAATRWATSARSTRPWEPQRSTDRRATRSTTSRIEASTPSAARDVTPRPVIPQGTIRPNQPRSGSTLSANPCMDRARDSRTPIAAILRGRTPSGSTHTPVWRSKRPAARPRSPSTSIRSCSTPST